MWKFYTGLRRSKIIDVIKSTYNKDPQGAIAQMKLGKNQKVALSILKREKGADIKTLSALMNLPNCEIKKIIRPLEKKEAVVENRNINRNNKSEIFFKEVKSKMNMSKSQVRQGFYHELRNSNIFMNKIEGIEIEAQINFIHIFHSSIEENDTLNKMRSSSPKSYDRLTKGFLANIYFQLQDLQRKVSKWSDGEFEIIVIDNKIIRLVNARTKATVVFKSHYSKTFLNESKILSEVIFLLKRSIKEINESAVTIANKDYSTF